MEYLNIIIVIFRVVFFDGVLLAAYWAEEHRQRARRAPNSNMLLVKVGGNPTSKVCVQ
jgi:hypothetical protein